MNVQGILAGSALSLALALAASAAPAATPPDTNSTGDGFRILYSFGQHPGDGANPNGDLVRAADGAFYGVTSGGGTGACNNGFTNCGGIFRLSGVGREKMVVDFPLVDAASGTALYAAYSSPALAPDGSLTGVLAAPLGGIYTLARKGGVSIGHVFTGTAGSDPRGKVAYAPDGSFYGTTLEGGAFRSGTIFKVDPEGNYSVLHDLGSSPTDPTQVGDGLTLGPDGNFYGTSQAGGTLGEAGMGTVFRVTPAGQLTVLHTFTVFGEGSYPTGRLAVGPDGKLYGFTMYSSSGTHSEIFSITTTGVFSIVATDTPTLPAGGPVISADGTLYGASTPSGSCGVVFMYRMGVTTNLHSFGCGSSDGAVPAGGLWLDPDGYLYGATVAGGAGNVGTVYRIRQQLAGAGA